jgi:hypothetical protein
VLRAEEPDPEKRVIPLASFVEDRDNDGEARWLTAIGEGDPAYAAYYDNVSNQLGFFDSLDDVSQGPLTYLVMGWYSEKEDDPLYGPLSRTEWQSKLNDLGWSLGVDEPKVEERLLLAESAAKARWGQAGVKRKDDQDDRAVFYESGLADANPSAGDTAANMSFRAGTDTAKTSSSVLLEGSGLSPGDSASIKMDSRYFNSSIQGVLDASELVSIFENADFLSIGPGRPCAMA